MIKKIEGWNWMNRLHSRSKVQANVVNKPKKESEAGIGSASPGWWSPSFSASDSCSQVSLCLSTWLCCGRWGWRATTSHHRPRISWFKLDDDQVYSKGPNLEERLATDWGWQTADVMVQLWSWKDRLGLGFDCRWFNGSEAVAIDFLTYIYFVAFLWEFYSNSRWLLRGF